METPLIILYTCNLRGDLDVLPRLYSFQRQLKGYYQSEEVVQLCALDPAQPPGRVLLLDLGDSCAPEVWHCEVTGGRSTLVVLDGMGYDAARVDDAPGKRAKMGDGVRLALVDESTPFMIEDVLITANADSRDGMLAKQAETRPYTLQIILSPAAVTRMDGVRLSCATPAQFSAQFVGAVVLTRAIDGWSIVTHEIHELPRRTLPDPTITASVDFVLSEARYAQKRKSAKT